MGSCYYKPWLALAGWSSKAAGSGSVGGDGEVEEPWWLGELERSQDGLLPGCGGRALCDLTLGGGQGDQVHPVEFVADVAPGLIGGVLDHPKQQQGQPAQLDVRADPVLAVVEDRAQAEGCLLYTSDAADDLTRVD